MHSTFNVALNSAVYIECCCQQCSVHLMLLSTVHCTFIVAVNSAVYIECCCPHCSVHLILLSTMHCTSVFISTVQYICPLPNQFQLSQQFPQQSAIPNSTQNCPVVAVVIHVDRQTDSMITFQWKRALLWWFNIASSNKTFCQSPCAVYSVNLVI